MDDGRLPVQHSGSWKNRPNICECAAMSQGKNCPIEIAAGTSSPMRAGSFSNRLERPRPRRWLIAASLLLAAGATTEYGLQLLRAVRNSKPPPLAPRIFWPQPGSATTRSRSITEAAHGSGAPAERITISVRGKELHLEGMGELALQPEGYWTPKKEASGVTRLWFNWLVNGAPYQLSFCGFPLLRLS